MRKQYAMVFLLILAFGVVSTMAFQLTTTDDQIPEAYAISDDGTEASVSSIKVRPSMGGDRMIIKLGLADMTSGNSYAIGIELTDTAGDYGYYNATGMLTAPYPNGYKEYLVGYYETTYTATAANESITIYFQKTNIWIDINGMMVQLSDIV